MEDKHRMTETNFQTVHEHWDREWSREEGRAGWLEPEDRVSDVLPLLRKRNVENVLDHGCGVGRHAIYLAEQGFNCWGMDASETGLQYGRKAARSRGVDVEFMQASVASLPFSDEEFGYVVSWNVIHHGTLDDARESLAEIRRVMRSGGILQGTFLSTRNAKFGRGRNIAPSTYVIDAEEEKSHPHCYCNARQMVTLLAGFDLLKLELFQQEEPDSYHWHYIAEIT